MVNVSNARIDILQRVLIQSVHCSFSGVSKLNKDSRRRPIKSNTAPGYSQYIECFYPSQNPPSASLTVLVPNTRTFPIYAALLHTEFGIYPLDQSLGPINGALFYVARGEVPTARGDSIVKSAWNGRTKIMRGTPHT